MRPPEPHADEQNQHRHHAVEDWDGAQPDSVPLIYRLSEAWRVPARYQVYVNVYNGGPSDGRRDGMAYRILGDYIETEAEARRWQRWFYEHPSRTDIWNECSEQEIRTNVSNAGAEQPCRTDEATKNSYAPGGSETARPVDTHNEQSERYAQAHADCDPFFHRG